MSFGVLIFFIFSFIFIVCWSFDSRTFQLISKVNTIPKSIEVKSTINLFSINFPKGYILEKVHPRSV